MSKYCSQSTVKTDMLIRYLLSDGLCSVKKIETKDVYGKWQESWGVKSFFEEIYMLEPK